jgi:hypothetical protein
MKNKGLHQYRFKDNPLEEVYAEAWEAENKANPGTLEGRGWLDYLLAKDNNSPMGEVSKRDREVAATVIQWLGSPIGQNFIKDCQEHVPSKLKKKGGAVNGNIDIFNGYIHRVKAGKEAFIKVDNDVDKAIDSHFSNRSIKTRKLYVNSRT